MSSEKYSFIIHDKVLLATFSWKRDIGIDTDELLPPLLEPFGKVVSNYVKEIDDLKLDSESVPLIDTFESHFIHKGKAYRLHFVFADFENDQRSEIPFLQTVPLAQYQNQPFAHCVSNVSHYYVIEGTTASRIDFYNSYSHRSFKKIEKELTLKIAGPYDVNEVASDQHLRSDFTIAEPNSSRRRPATEQSQQQQQQQQNSSSNDHSDSPPLGRGSPDFDASDRRRNEDIRLADLCGCSGGVRSSSAMGEVTAKAKCLVSVGVVIVVGIIILICSSFADVHYYQYGFVKSRSTGSVDTRTVYESGRHFVGPDKYFKTFKATAHIVSLRDIEIFTRDKLEVTITVNIQYFLNKDDLAELHSEYDIFYQDVFKQTAKDVVKGAVTDYATRQFIDNRPEIEQKIFTALRKRFSGTCCEPLCDSKVFKCLENCIQPRTNCTKADKGLFSTIRYFQLGDVKIPQDVQQRYLLTLTRRLDSEKEKFVQETTIVRKETEMEVRQIENEATEIRRNATAEATYLVAKANADAKFMVEAAHRDGLKNMYSKLDVTDEKDKAQITYLRSINQNDDIHLSVGFTDLRLNVPGT